MDTWLSSLLASWSLNSTTTTALHLLTNKAVLTGC
jgi:hypothetical protein